MFQTGSAPGIELYEGFPFHGIAIDLSVRLARLAFTRSVPSAIPRGGPSLASRAFISAEVRCRPGTEAPVPPVPPLSLVPLQGPNASATDPVVPAPPPLGLASSRRRTACSWLSLRSLDRRRPWRLPQATPSLLGFVHLVSARLPEEPVTGFPVAGEFSVPDWPS